ncbi:cell wall anchor protein [Couchioplanes caeruleus]|uniref:cell wall anchor protein n=1 Tax=Couchioplanes caeruleus TaxID=56438 RepID=UPI0020BFE25B|nr:cell wall anchor protein [Couchioplanes caeruleus]UQU66199.1 cell wall anchor protein [Couchioplanes caeruleus]
MSKSLLHRIAAVAAGALLALTGAAAVAGPAVAAGPQTTVAGAAACNPDKGEWLVSWTLTNSGDTFARVDKLRTEPAPVPELANGYLIPRRAPSGTIGKVVLHQTLPGGTPSATVSFVGIWDDAKDTDNTATVTLGDCTPAETPCVEPADATFHHDFAVGDGRATATVTLDDGVKLCHDEPVTLVTYFAPKPEFSLPQYAHDHETATLSNDNRSVALAAHLPDCNAQVDLFFGGEDDIISEITEGGPRYGDKKLGSNNGPGSRSQGPQGWYNGGGKGCQTPAVEPLSQCDGTVQLNLSNNGEISRYAVDFTVTAGDFTRTVTVKPGKAETVTVPAGSGTITVSADGMADVTYDWKRPEDCEPPAVSVANDCETVTVTVTNPHGAVPAAATVTYGTESKQVTVAPGTSEAVTFPAGDARVATIAFPGLGIEPITAALGDADCDNGGGSGGTPGTPTTSPTPGTPPTGGDGGGLPVTGAAAGAIAGGALALLIAGGVLFFLARRRRVTFTP